jgi:hypothetical protein
MDSGRLLPSTEHLFNELKALPKEKLSPQRQLLKVRPINTLVVAVRTMGQGSAAYGARSGGRVVLQIPTRRYRR